MSRSFVDCTSGQTRYRTTLLPIAHALSFAACLTANSRRFVDVQVRNHGADRGFVTYLPTSKSRQMAIWRAHADSRRARAEAESPAYLWNLQIAADSSRAWYLCQSTTGETYEVTPQSCTCADFTYRGSKSGMGCKHIEAYQLAAAGKHIESLSAVKFRVLIPAACARATAGHNVERRAYLDSLYATAPAARR